MWTHLREVGHAERVVKMPDPLNRTIEQLSAEFRPFVNPDEVTDVVAQCCRDLNTAPWRARPELVERLARKRLADTTGYGYTRAVDHGLFAGSSVRVVVRFGTARQPLTPTVGRTPNRH